MKIAILCADDDSNYYKLNDPDLIIYNRERDAWTFTGTEPVICHAPCHQWSKMRAFSRFNMSEKMLAYHCWEAVNRNGGIFEHPVGSSFFNAVHADMTKVISVNQHWWGFPARKPTLLYFNKCSHLSFPLSFSCVEFMLGTSKGKARGKTPEMNKAERSRMPIEFCKYLVDSIRETYISAR